MWSLMVWCVMRAVTFYRNKQKKRTGSEENFAECIKISTAEGMSKMFSTTKF